MAVVGGTAIAVVFIGFVRRTTESSIASPTMARQPVTKPEALMLALKPQLWKFQITNIAKKIG